MAAQKALANEAYLEEYNRLDLELKQLQHELADTVRVNDDLTKQIAQKEEELLTKDKRLESLRDRNIADSEQLELELTTLSEKYSFEVSAKEEMVRKLEVQYKRYLEIEKENNALRETVERLQLQMENDRNEHALKMHEKNLEMKTLREVMEKKMRDQLNKMDISYQKDAFAALSERHKKAMFQNAKLKDEVALQGVGLNNLGSRLGKQNQQHDLCVKQLKALNKKLRGLKERLAIIATKKIEIARKKEEVLVDEAQLQHKRQCLKARLDAEPSTAAIAEEREQLHIQILNTRCDVIMWTQRLQRLQDLNMNLKPVYGYETEGRFNPRAFPLEASVSLHSSIGRGSHSRGRLSSGVSISPQHSQGSRSQDGSRSPSPLRSGAPSESFPASSPQVTFAAGTQLDSSSPTASVAGNSTSSSNYAELRAQMTQVPMMVKPGELEDLIERDPNLGTALAPLRGKEAQLLVSMPDETPHHKHGGDGHHPEGAQQQQVVQSRDQNMIAWITLKIVDIWESTRLDSERLKAEKYVLLEQMLDALHSENMMASLYTDSSKQTGPGHGVALGGALAPARVASSAGAGAAEAGHDQASQSPIAAAKSPSASVAAASLQSTGKHRPPTLTVAPDDDEDLSMGDSSQHSLHTINESVSKDERDASTSARLAAQERALQLETENLLSESAKSLGGISGLTTAYPSEKNFEEMPHAHVSVPPLQLGLQQHLQSHSHAPDAQEHSVQMGLHSESTPGAPRPYTRDAERDWIENGDLNEDAVHQLWDEAFAHPSAHLSSQPSYADGLQVLSPEKPVTSWLKPVAPARRYPVSTEHEFGGLSKPLHSKKGAPHHKKKESDSRPVTSDTQDGAAAAAQANFAPTHGITAALLLRDIRPVDPSAAFHVGPPILLHDKTSEEARDNIQEMRRSLTLPRIPSATRMDKSQSTGELGASGLNYTGLEVTEDGLVLKDPLLGKKFAAQRKLLVANATKAAAALRKATIEQQRAHAHTTPAPAAAGGGSVGSGAAGMPHKAQHKHAMSSNLVGEKTAVKQR